MFMLHPYNKKNCNLNLFSLVMPFLSETDMTRPKCLHMKMCQLLSVSTTVHIHVTKLEITESLPAEVTFILFLHVFDYFSPALPVSVIYNE